MKDDCVVFLEEEESTIKIWKIAKAAPTPSAVNFTEMLQANPAEEMTVNKYHLVVKGLYFVDLIRNKTVRDKKKIKKASVTIILDSTIKEFSKAIMSAARAAPYTEQPISLIVK
eukprot:Anaeramoba_flamelloidesc24415_g1_i1.p2 GENE.c24415_g1_i1~~c24415_g1_i1.p2  ORF type:complete len:114 (+),score=37.02 c24415_g1_i1:265-606(+)